ncbi:MAG: PAS domain S-box protein [Chloroflexota bacterium]
MNDAPQADLSPQPCEHSAESPSMTQSDPVQPVQPTAHAGASLGNAWSSAFDALPDLIALIDTDYRILRANQAMAQALETTPEALAGQTCFRCMHGRNFPLDSCPHARLMADGQAHSAEIPEPRLGGHFLVTATPLLDEAGQVAGCLHIARDITPLKRSEVILRESEQRFRMLYEHAPLGYQSLDENGCLIEVNQAWLELLGYSRQQVLGCWFGEFLAEGYVEKFRQNFLRFKSAGAIQGIEFEMLRQDGSHLVAAFDGRIGYDLHGNFQQTHCILRNVTAQRRAEAALRASEEKYRTVADFTYDWEYWLVPDGQLHYVSPACERITGYQVDEFLHNPALMRQIIHPQDLESMAPHFQTPLPDSEKACEIEFRIITRQGQVRWIDHACRPVFDPEGRFLGYRGSNRDATQRVHLEEALRQSELQYRRIVETAQEGIWMMDAERRTTYVNPCMAAMLGRTAEEMLGQEVSVFMFADDLPAHEQRMLERQDGAAGKYEQKFCRADGSPVWCLVSATALSDEAGRFQGSFATFTDITGRKRMEQALFENEEHYRRLVELLPDLVAVHQDGSILFINDAGVRLLGAAGPDQVIGKSVKDFVIPPQQTTAEQRMQSLIAQGGRSPAYEQKLLRLDGTSIDIEVMGVVFQHQGKPTIQLVARDITARKRAERELQRSSEMLNLIRQAQSKYISHGDPKAIFGDLLEALVAITDSEYGFLDEVQTDAQGRLYKRSLALSNLAWDQASQQLYEQFVAADFTFANLKNLAGAPALSGQVVIANDAPHDRRAGGLPPGHPPIRAYLGMPLFYGGTLIGVAGVANRPGGYDEHMAGFLEPFTTTCASIIHAVRQDRLSEQTGEALRTSEEKFRQFFALAPDYCYMVSPDGIILDVNQSALQALGYRRDELTGKPLVVTLYAPESRTRSAELLETWKQQGYLENEELTIMTRSGQKRTVLLSTSAVRDAAGNLLHTISIQRDITERKQAEESLRQSLHEKEALLKEIHHRVKNNLQVVNSLLSLQAGQVSDPPTRQALFETQNRVRSMAFIHELLYRSADLGQVDFNDYLQKLTGYLYRSYVIDPDLIRLEIDVQQVTLSIDQAVPCGLMVNELVTNCFKHAFPAGRAGTIQISMQRHTGQVILAVRDNGIGLPEGLELATANTLGFQLIQALSVQLKCSITLERAKGTHFTLTFQD